VARSGAQTRPSGPEEAAAFLAKAEEFLRAAQDSLGLGNNTAAVGNAVHAGILAADAIAAALSRAVWRGEHAQAPAHLEAQSVAKFDQLVAGRVDIDLANEIKAAVHSIEKIKVKQLMSLLTRVQVES
jgi:hypothetical protein